MRPTALACLAAPALALSACAAGGGPGRPAAAAGVEDLQAPAAFTAPEELAAIGRRAAPASVFAGRQADGAAWEVRDAPAQIPAQVEHAPAGFWDGLLAAEAARRPGAVRLTEPMACLARLAGRYMLDRSAGPGPSALTFLAERCGVADPRVGYAFTLQPLRGGEADGDVERLLRPVAEDGLRKALDSGSATAGIWFGRERLRALAMVAYAFPRARLDAPPAAPGPGGHVVLRGELLRPADRIDALVNRGRYGFRRCAIDAGVALPRFAVDCETDPADDSEVIEIAAFAAKRVMGPIAIRARVWPSGRLPNAFRPPPGTGGSGRASAAALVASLNQVRAAAGLAPVSLARSQSETAELLAPHYFAADAAQRGEELDSIAVGVMAGWQVDGLVRAGHFAASWTDEGAGEGGLVARVLERPSGREALLDPDVRAVAVGMARAEGKVGAVFGTYAFLEAGSPAAEAAIVIRRIDEARARKGLPPSMVLDRLSRDVAEIAQAVERGERNPRAAMKSALEKAVQATPSGRAYAWVGFGDRLDRVALPEEVLAAPAVRMAVGVAHCRPRGSPWYGYCVLVAAIRQSVTASADPTAGSAGSEAG